MRKIQNKVIKSGIWFTVGNFIVKGIGFITTPIFTRFLSKVEYGDFSNFTTWVGIFAIIVSLNLESSLIRARFDFEEDIDKYVLSMISLSALSTLIWYLIVIVFETQFQHLLSMNMKYIIAMFIYLLFYPSISLFQTSERFKYRYKWTVASSLLIAVSTSLLSVILVIISNDKLFGRVCGYVLPYIFVGIAIIIYYVVKGKTIDIKYWKYALPITLPFIPHLLSMILLGSMDRVMIRQICGSEATALYSLSYTCGTLISILVTSLNNAYSPWLGEQLSQKKYNYVRKAGTPYAIGFSYVACGIVLLTPEILYVLGGSGYIEAKFVMPPVAGGCILQFLYCMYVNVEQYEKRTKGMALASVIAAVLNFILNYIFIPKFGYIAAAYTTYMGYLSLLLMHMWLVKYIGRGDVYDNKKILLIAVCVSVFMCISNFMFEFNAIRYIVIVIYVGFGFGGLLKNKDKLLNFIK